MDRFDRRGFLQCMAWAGTGVVWAAAGGVLSSRLITEASAADAAAGSFTFVQISDTHIGFKGEANKDAAATLQQVVDRVNGLRPAPAFVLHTGDQTHGQKAGAFDTVAEILKTVKTERIFCPANTTCSSTGARNISLATARGPSTVAAGSASITRGHTSSGS